MSKQKSLQSPSKKELCNQRTALIQRKQQNEERERDLDENTKILMADIKAAEFMLKF
jgi:hypothetical protein